MSDRNSIYCPNCKRYSSLIERTGFDKKLSLKYGYVLIKRYSISECNSCSQHFLVIRDDGKIIKIYPDRLPKTVNELIPQDIKTDFEEALLCYSVGAYRGAFLSDNLSAKSALIFTPARRIRSREMSAMV
jgi:hypothetical protein